MSRAINQLLALKIMEHPTWDVIFTYEYDSEANEEGVGMIHSCGEDKYFIGQRDSFDGHYFFRSNTDIPKDVSDIDRMDLDILYAHYGETLMNKMSKEEILSAFNRIPWENCLRVDIETI